MATDKLINHSQGADIIDALDDIATNLGNISYGEQTSADKVVAMTGYEKASTAEAISQADTLNEAVGKLEKKVDDNATDITDKVDTVKMGINGAEFTPTDGTVTLPVMGASGANHAVGLVPDPGSTSGATKFLREDGSWAEPSSSSSGSSSLSDLDTTKTTNKPNRWDTVYFDGFSFSADHVWSDGINTYYSSGNYQEILDKINQVWTNKTWSGLTEFQGKYVWTDGTNIFYSAGTSHYVLNISTSTWSSKSWTGLTDFYGDSVWTDGTTTYYSDGSTQYYLDKSSDIWRSTSWNIYIASPDYIWSDGTNLYYSNGSSQYILNRDTGDWDEKVWTGLTSFSGASIWTDGEDIYHSSSTQNVLDIANSKWYVKQWLGSYQPSGIYVWSDGLNTYHSNGNTKYVLVKPVKSTKVPYTMSNEELTSAVQNKVSVRVENGTLIFS